MPSDELIAGAAPQLASGLQGLRPEGNIGIHLYVYQAAEIVRRIIWQNIQPNQDPSRRVQAV
jgi:hypothetical protein